MRCRCASQSRGVLTAQDATTLRNVSRSVVTQNDTRPAPPLRSLAPNGTFLGVSGPERQLSFAARLIPYVQPVIYSQRFRVASILGAAGLYNGSFSAPSGVNLTEAAGIANARCVRHLRGLADRSASPRTSPRRPACVARAMAGTCRLSRTK